MSLFDSTIHQDFEEETRREYVAHAEHLARRARQALEDLGVKAFVTHDEEHGLKITVTAFLGGGLLNADRFVNSLEDLARKELGR